MKRRWLALVLVTVAAVTSVVIWFDRPYPSRATFEQVREGMTFEEVCVTVGGPPGDYADGWSLTYLVCRIGGASGRMVKLWAAEDAVLSVEFNDEERVTEVRIHEPRLRPARPIPDRFRARLGL